MHAHRLVLVAIMLAVLAWGTLHAAGAYTFNHNPLRPLMVMACVLGFLGFWGLLLLARGLRHGRSQDGK